MIRIEQQIPTEQYGFIKVTVENDKKASALKEFKAVREDIAPFVREDRGEAVVKQEKVKLKGKVESKKSSDDDF